MTNAIFVKSEQLSPTIHSFWFKPTDHVEYTAGQFVEIRIAHKADERGQDRWFTLSSSPNEELMAITTRLAKTPSTFKQKLFSLGADDVIEVSQAMGDFVLPMQKSLPILFVVRGIGITPARSIVKQLAISNEQRDVSLYYSVNDANDFIFQDDFKMLGDASEHVASNEESAITDSCNYILKSINDRPFLRVYISGPEPFVEALYEMLRKNDVNQNNLLTDYFHGYNA